MPSRQCSREGIFIFIGLKDLCYIDKPVRSFADMVARKTENPIFFIVRLRDSKRNIHEFKKG